MTDSTYTEIAMVVDRSGSMAGIAKVSEEGIQAFVESQKKLEGKCNFTLVEFDTVPKAQSQEFGAVHSFGFNGYEPKINTVYSGPIGKFRGYKLIARGGTPLLDAIGKTVNELGTKLAIMREEDRPGTVIVVVQTDGHENSSREFNTESIKALIETQTRVFNWSFIFLGADQDAVTAGQDMGFAANSSISYSSTDYGTRAVYESVAEASSTLRSGLAYEGFTDDQRNEATK